MTKVYHFDMNQKPKPCKGNYRVLKHNGCGKEVYHRKHGLCMSCFWEWMNTTEAGKIYKATKFENQVQKKTIQRNKERKKSKKIELMTCDKYRQVYVQPKINEIARTIDYGQPCIASQRHYGKMAGGHRISVGSNRTTAINLHNIHIQSFESNSFKGGDERKYDEGIVREYGQDYLEFLRSLKQTPYIKLTKDDWIEVKLRASNFLRELDKIKRSPSDRIMLRNQANEAIGIYQEKQSQYNGLLK